MKVRRICRTMEFPFAKKALDLWSYHLLKNKVGICRQDLPRVILWWHLVLVHERVHVGL